MTYQKSYANKADRMDPTEPAGAALESSASRLRALAAKAIEIATAAGAGDVRVELSETDSRNVAVRNQLPAQRSVAQQAGMTLTIYHDGKVASASTIDVSDAAIAATARAAMDIAAVTEVDRWAGLADPACWASESVDLDLCHPWDISLADAVELALDIERAALRVDPRVVQTEGAFVSSATGYGWMANSRGFSRGSAWSSHALSCVPVAMSDGEKQIDSWSMSMRAAEDLAAPCDIGRIAAERVRDKLGARQIASRTCPVLFRADTAHALLGALTGALSGDTLYQGRSFLRDRKGDAIFPKHIQMVEDPFIVRGAASGYFDADGIAGSRREVIGDGTLNGYFLSLYASRRLEMASTGNGFGPFNLSFASDRTMPGDDEAAMIRALGTGLFVTGSSGGGVDLLTGDFSRAVTGFWVERGEIQYPVSNVTAAGNLADMFRGLLAVGADTLTRGAFSSGSWLIDGMSIGGQ
jgi:PmbA protein